MKTRRQAVGPRGLAAALSKATRQLFRRRGFAQGAVLTQWPAIVGEELAASSCPEKLSFPPGRGAGATLHVRVASGFAIELQHLEPLVVERINTYFGYPAVARLAMVQGPLPEMREVPRPVARALDAAEEEALGARVAGTDDEGLRAALSDLGRRVRAAVGAPEGRRS